MIPMPRGPLSHRNLLGVWNGEMTESRSSLLELRKGFKGEIAHASACPGQEDWSEKAGEHQTPYADAPRLEMLKCATVDQQTADKAAKNDSLPAMR